jgi:penicillin-binding protein 1A
VVFDDDSLESTWRPENYSGKVYGPTRMREALIKSRNLVSIRILQSIGLRFATSYIQRFGFERENMPYDLSLALGSGTYSPLQVARGYAVFSNGGYLIDPYIIDRVESGSGETIYQSQPKTVCQGCETEDLTERAAAEKALSEQDEATETDAAAEATDETTDTPADDEAGPRYAPRVITAQNAYIMRSIMREVVQRGTAVRAKALGRKDIAGKTGTTNDQVDAWFSGYNDQVVTTAWVGFDNQRHMGRRETGGRAALPMWINFMRVALDGMPENLQEQPEGLVTIRIDAETGKRADGNTTKSLFELFREENAPRQKAVVKSNSGDTNGIVVNVPESEDEIVEDIF